MNELFLIACCSNFPEHHENHYSYPIERSNLNLPLVIGVPGGILLVVIIMAFLFFQRRRKTQYHQGAIVNGPHFNRVPTQDPEPYLGSMHSGEVKTNIHVNPIHGTQHKNLYAGIPSPHHMLSSREKLSKNSQSIDFYTDISSVSQSHHNPHHHMQQYSYNGPWTAGSTDLINTSLPPNKVTRLADFMWNK